MQRYACFGEMVTYFVDHLPATLHLLIMTRSDPPLPLARWRAHDDLYELRAADLRFSLAETQTFLRQALPFSLSAEAITRLDARTVAAARASGSASCR